MHALTSSNAASCKASPASHPDREWQRGENTCTCMISSSGSVCGRLDLSVHDRYDVHRRMDRWVDSGWVCAVRMRSRQVDRSKRSIVDVCDSGG